VCHSGGIDKRRDDICLYLNPADRAKLEEIVANRNSPRKWVWRAEIVLATADGLGTNAIMRRTGKSKPCVWRWQERYIDKGVPGRLRDKTRPSPHQARLGRTPRLVAADAAFYAAKNEAAAKAKGVKRVCIPNLSTKSPERKREQRKALVLRRPKMAHRIRGAHYSATRASSE
jgi:hypothetical protein